jgi:prepilin-type N-terminal cleavage/methylation domain-containing protein
MQILPTPNHHSRCRHPRFSRATRGFTLLELVVVVAITLVALGQVTTSMLGISRLEPLNRESAIAMNAGIGAVQALRGAAFDEAFQLYNENAADDPDGPGTAPGSSFAVPLLDVIPGDEDGMVGQIVFPAVGDDIREDVVDAQLGMPRDLNGDGVVDAMAHTADCEILPVLVRLQWVGKSGPRTMNIYSALTTP